MTAFFSACSPGNKKDDQEPARYLPIAGCFNFRDMGGYQTPSGKQVKWGKVFRSDNLWNLTSNDLEYLNNIPLRTIVDFRSEQEIEEAPDRKPASVMDSYALTITPGHQSDVNDPEKMSALVADNGERFMMEVYESFVTDPSIIARYRTFFSLLQDENRLPLLFHCTAGKDRTGIGAALFLASLGVDEETIYEDYMLSNRNLDKKYKEILDVYPNMSALLEVRPQYLQVALEQIGKHYGRIENYLRDVLKADPDGMKKLYLE
jgi:protein-tyrosine phosphatase